MSRSASRLRRIEQRVFAADPYHPARLRTMTLEQMRAEVDRLLKERLDWGQRVCGSTWKPYELPQDRIHRDAVIDYVSALGDKPPEQLSGEDIEMRIAVLMAELGVDQP